MGEDPDAIRREVEATRERMTETVDALGYKADVKSRTKEAVSDKVSTITGKVGEARDAIGGKVTDATDRVGEAAPSARDMKQTAQRAGGIAQDNPLGLAIGSVALGFLAGLLIPTTRIEDDKLAPVAGEVREKVQEIGGEAIDHGKQVAQETGQAAMEAAREAGQEHGDELRSSAQESAQDVRQHVG